MAVDPTGLPSMSLEAAGFQGTTPDNLNGVFLGEDGSRHYVRESKYTKDGREHKNVVWVGEKTAQLGVRPDWVTVFVGKRLGGTVTGRYVDVPKGMARGSALFSASVRGWSRALRLYQYGDDARTRRGSTSDDVEVRQEDQRRAESEVAGAIENAARIREVFEDLSQKVEQASELKERLVGFLDVEKPFQILRSDAEALRGQVEATGDQLTRLREQHDRLLDAHKLSTTKMEALDRRREELSRDMQDKERRVSSVEHAVRERGETNAAHVFDIAEVVYDDLGSGTSAQRGELVRPVERDDRHVAWRGRVGERDDDPLRRGRILDPDRVVVEKDDHFVRSNVGQLGDGSTTDRNTAAFVRGLTREGKTVVFSSHVLEVVEQVCSRVVILKDGRVVGHDSVERLRDLRRAVRKHGRLWRWPIGGSLVLAFLAVPVVLRGPLEGVDAATAAFIVAGGVAMGLAVALAAASVLMGDLGIGLRHLERECAARDMCACCAGPLGEPSDGLRICRACGATWR